MRIPLQDIGHADSQYERPNQTWVCGWARDGNPCRFGPDERGNCTVAAQSICEPVKEGDRWVCTRSDALGGPCTAGPSPNGTCCHPPPEQPPCQPQRSLRSRRTRLSIGTGLFAIAILLIWMTGPASLSLVSPGELSAAHLAIEGPPGLPNCASCHKDVKPGLDNWLMRIAEQTDSHSFETSQQCLTCHFDDTAQDIAFSVHSTDSLDPAKELTERPSLLTGSTGWLLSVTAATHGPPVTIDGQIPCGDCHKEHRGKKNTMTQMSDTQCQVCHTNQFESFNQGHPEFVLPVATTGIAFDHARHQARFDNGMDCRNCHQGDPEGKTMVVKPFEQSCRGCHEQGSRDHHGDAIRKNPVAFLQLPEMEFEDPVYWPLDDAIGENLTPMMTLLLLGDDEAVPLLGEIHDEDLAAGDLYEWFFVLEDEDEGWKKAELAIAIKRLVAELADYSREGAENRLTRLARAFSLDPGDRELQTLQAELSSANFVMQMFKQRYLPQLAADLAGDEVSAADDEEGTGQWMTSRHMSGWRVDSEEGAISYRAVTHSDYWLKTWIEVLNKQPEVRSADPDLAETRTAIRTLMLDELSGDFKACTKCHVSNAGEKPWQATGRVYDTSGFMLFNHRPHMAMLNESDNCRTCHKPEEETTESAVNMPRGFLPQSKETCSACHAPGEADNSCLNCHQYHHERP